MPSPNPSICRLCGNAHLDEIIDLGEVPSIHDLRKEGTPLPLFPIRVFLCQRCGLAQMPYAEAVTDLYTGSAIYTTSHQRGAYLGDLIDTLNACRSGRSVLEIGCNDGRLLDVLRDSGFSPAVGIEPNAITAAAARQRGFVVHQRYFDDAAASFLLAEHGRFDVVVSRHVLEHVDRIGEFMNAIDRVLSEQGVLLLELPHAEPGFAAGAPNVLWEEHVNYFFEPVLEQLLRNHGFRPMSWRYYTGGALVIAVFATRTPRPSKPEWRFPPELASCLRDFRGRVERYRQRLSDLLQDAARRGFARTVYGAGFRSATTINAMKIAEQLDWIIDDRADLSGYLMPGTGIRISPLAEIVEERPVLLMLGVGAEHEYKIIEKARRHFSATVVPLSLVYPGDVLTHCEAAARMMAEEHRPATSAVPG